MRCEYAENCGFYLYLKARGKAADQDCGKERKEECPRYGEKRGIKLTGYQRQAYHLRESQKQMYPILEAVTGDELRLASRHGMFEIESYE